MCLILLLGIVHIFNSSSTSALTFLLSSPSVVRWLYPWNIKFRRRDLLVLINECLVQRDTSIVISFEVSSRHDTSLDCVKLIYLDTLNQRIDLRPGTNPHMPMYIEPLKDVVLILLNFHVMFKVEPLKFTRVMRDNRETFGLTHHVIYIICYQEMVPQVMVGLPSISCPLGWLDISPSV